ncbi:hypothetical protein H0H92_003297 [Tricholoma furcatifolium]|nr:hypothetical protein H0H92_003297 [Tricholoma furcatifolium]
MRIAVRVYLAVFTLSALLTLIAHAASVPPIHNPHDALFSALIPAKQLATYTKLRANPGWFPQYTDAHGAWKYFPANSWGSGIFPASLYALHARRTLCPATPANGLGLADWLALGRAVTTGMIPPDPEGSPDHDRASLISILEELEFDSTNVTAQNYVIGLAKILANRFNPAVGCSRGFDSSDPFKVIIDSMMNVHPLLLAGELTGNSTLYDMGISHADTTMKNHIREDGSTWQLVEYNSTTGDVVGKLTIQGYANNSTWSRGQAWGIYTFANGMGAGSSASSS